jgi:hypothetical protein
MLFRAKASTGTDRMRGKSKGRLRRGLSTVGSTSDLPVLYNGHFRIVQAFDVRVKSTSKCAAGASISHAPTHCRPRFPITLATTPFALKFLSSATKITTVLKTRFGGGWPYTLRAACAPRWVCAVGTCKYSRTHSVAPAPIEPPTATSAMP